MVQQRVGGGTSIETSGAERRRLALLIGVLVVTCAGSAWWFLRDKRPAGPGAAGATQFALAVCAAVAADDIDAFTALHVEPNDGSVDGKYLWMPFPGGAMGDFGPWRDRVRATFRRLRASVERDVQCAEVVSVDAPASPSRLELDQGAVHGAVVRVEGRGDLVVGPSVMTERGRAFAGLRSGAFVRWADEEQVPEPSPAADTPAVAEQERDLAAPDTPPTPATELARPGDPDTTALVAELRGGGFPSTRAMTELIARGEREAVVKILFERLRSDDRFSAQRAHEDLRSIGERPDYSRFIPMSPETGPESTDALELAIEIDGDQLRVHWKLHFGSDLFGTSKPPYFKIALSGGSLATEIEKQYSPQPGINAGSEAFTTVAPGKYAATAFLWSTLPDGTQVSDNAAAVFLDIR